MPPLLYRPALVTQTLLDQRELHRLSEPAQRILIAALLLEVAGDGAPGRGEVGGVGVGELRARYGVSARTSSAAGRTSAIRATLSPA